MARHGQLPAVRVAGTDLTRPVTEPGGRPRPVLVLRLDTTLIEAAGPKAQAAGTDQGGFGCHRLTGWCSAIGDAVAVMQRPGNAASVTTADHLAVSGLVRPDPRAVAHRRAGQHRRRGASHDVIDHLTSLTTAPEHGRRGRRVEYTIGWPVDDQTMAGIEQPCESDGGAAVDTDPDPAARVADLTGVLRRGPDGDRADGRTAGA